MNKNIEWVSGVKAVGILAVILGHINSPFSVFIFSWHMPLFFMLSGFFIKIEVNLKEYIVKNWKRLMIPYFIFSCIAIIVESIKRLLLHRDMLNYFEEMKGILFWMDMNHLIHSYAFVLWFLPALFFSKLLYYVIKKNVSNILFQICIVIFLFVISFHVQLPFAFAYAMNAVLWIFIGSILYNHFFCNPQLNNFCFNFVQFLSVLILLGIYLFLDIPNLNISLLNYGNKFFNVLWAISFVVLLISFFKVLTRMYQLNHLIKQWGQGTMLLFIFHVYTNNIANILVEKLGIGGWSLKLAISLCLLQIILAIKSNFNHWCIFKYV